MSTLCLTDGQSSLNLVLITWDGDAYVGVEVSSHGFSGRNDLHVVSGSFRSFCANLLSLQRSLKGEAQLVGVRPEELDIRIAPANSRGHISVRGHTGYHIGAEEQSYWHAVHFGFTVLPQQLDAATKVPWVLQYAA
jgi:hypothetical protein